MQIVIDVPDRYLLNVNTAEMARQLKLYTALVMFQSGQVVPVSLQGLIVINFWLNVRSITFR